MDTKEIAKEIRWQEEWIPLCYSDEWVVGFYEGTLFLASLKMNMALRDLGEAVMKQFPKKP